jgi:putative flippase GtrA
MNLNIIKYLLISCLASAVDLGISNYLYQILHINYLLACNLGIAAGFLFQYFIGMKYVFSDSRKSKSFVIYLSTFIIGLMLATATMWMSYSVLDFTFFYSKIMSMLLPFFITYFVRKTLLGTKSAGGNKYENSLQI